MTTNPTEHTTTQTPTATRYVYFVGFQYMDGRGLGFSNVEIPLGRQITSLAHVQEFERFLRTHGYRNALVMGFNLLRTEAVQSGGAR